MKQIMENQHHLENEIHVLKERHNEAKSEVFKTPIKKQKVLNDLKKSSREMPLKRPNSSMIRRALTTGRKFKVKN